MKPKMSAQKVRQVARLCARWKREARAIDEKEKKIGWLKDQAGRQKNLLTEQAIQELVAPEQWWRVYIEWNLKMWRFAKKTAAALVIAYGAISGAQAAEKEKQPTEWEKFCSRQLQRELDILELENLGPQAKAARFIEITGNVDRCLHEKKEK